VATRIASGLFLGLALVLVTWYGGWPFLAVWVVAAGLAAREFYALAGRGGVRPLEIPGVLAAALLVAGVGLRWPPPWLGATVAGLIVAALALLLPAGGTAEARRVLTDWGATVAGVAYVAPPLALLVLLRAGQFGLGWVILLFAITWSCDTGAYFAGRAFGRTPFFPLISPNKTREGAIAGVLAGAVAAVAAAGVAHLHPLLALAAGGSVAAAAEAGDLAESLLKRQVGVKDSGTLIPGHGGLFDRIDSLLFAVVVLFYWRLLT